MTQSFLNFIHYFNAAIEKPSEIFSSDYFREDPLYHKLADRLPIRMANLAAKDALCFNFDNFSIRFWRPRN